MDLCISRICSAYCDSEPCTVNVFGILFLWLELFLINFSGFRIVVLLLHAFTLQNTMLCSLAGTNALSVWEYVVHI